MKIQYNGIKEQIWISFPLSALGRKSVVQSIQFIKKTPVEVKDEWARELVSKDSNFEEVLLTELPQEVVPVKKASKGRVKISIHPPKQPYGELFEEEIEKKLGATL